MRYPGFAMVLLSALLGTGGVTVQSHAESDPAGWVDLTEGMTELPGMSFEEPPICQMQPQRRRVRLERPARELDDVVFSLDAKGYNYARPGEHRPAPPASAR